MSDDSSAGIQQSDKSGGDASAGASAGSSSGASAHTWQSGRPIDPTVAGSGAYAGAGAGAAGGDVTDQTHIGSINVSS
ncbi:MAG: hypothetical protein QF546_00495 [Alphaproteobacteria bacterium]|jgi:hypothetical protein|nr:hypothetical protein [Alphaproteobacteria bacterium]MDP7602290.1 hypothetical protein [Alphaproteobacteria bacterium]